MSPISPLSSALPFTQSSASFSWHSAVGLPDQGRPTPLCTKQLGKQQCSMRMGGLAMSCPSRRPPWPWQPSPSDRHRGTSGPQCGPGRAEGVSGQWSERGWSAQPVGFHQCSSIHPHNHHFGSLYRGHRTGLDLDLWPFTLLSVSLST